MSSTEGSIEEKIQQAYLMATARLPRPEELTLLKGRFERSLELFRNDPSAAGKLLHVGETKVNAAHDETQIAAMTTVTSLILNLDEVVNRE